MRPLPLLTLCAFLPGCLLHVARHHRHPSYDEIEPNDSALEAPLYAGLRPGDGFTLHGHVQAFGFDLYDGAAVRVDAPLELVFDLDSHAHASDLDVCVYDPDLGQFVVCADGPSDPEHGSVIVLEAGKVLHLVVTSAAGDAPYSLRVHAREALQPLATAPSALLANDPAKAARRAGYHAELRAPAGRVIEARLFDLDTGAVRTVRAVRRAGRLELLSEDPAR